MGMYRPKKEFEPVVKKEPKKFKYVGKGLKPDPRYESYVVAKFINCVMWEGKKSIAEKWVYRAIDELHRRVPDVEPITIFETALNNVKPIVEVKSKRVGGATYQVPVEVSKHRQQSLATRWILDAVRKKKGGTFWKRLSSELFDAYNKQGSAMTVRENTHKMAEANKAFAHFAR